MVLINGQPGDRISVVDRGFMYGDGVFRTLLVCQGKPLCWPRHYYKLAADAAALQIVCPPETALVREVEQVAAQQLECVVKIIVTRGLGNRGYRVDPKAPSNRVVMAFPLPHYPASYGDSGVTVRLCALRLAQQPSLAGIKSLNRLENVLARQEWDDPDIAEGLLMDEGGNMVEGTMTSLFVVRNGVLHAPDLSRCGVSGVTRDRVRQAAARLAVPVKIAPLPLAELLDSDEAFLGNSVIGIWPIARLSDKVWSQTLLTRAITRDLQAYVG